MKKPTRQEIAKKFDLWIDENDMPDLQSVFKAGIEYALEYQKPSTILKTYNQLGFDVDVKLIHDIMNGEVEHDLHDELYGVRDITFTSVDTSRTESNWSDTWITIYFTASPQGDSGRYENNSIKIDNRGRVFASVDEPFESGGVAEEIEEIIMGMVTKAKYNTV